MKSQCLFCSTLILLIAFQFCFGQTPDETQPTENWLNAYNIYSAPFLYSRYDRYSKNDVVKFREKLDFMQTANFKDEWEGIYGWDFPDEVGLSQLRLNSQIGYVDFYLYSCLPELRSVNYGKIINKDDSIQLLPEFVEGSPRKSEKITYIKVKWNNRHYLVEENSLSAFAEKAVGIYTEPTDGSIENRQKWANYWVNGDLEKPLSRLPEFPARYEKFLRLPIEAKIIAVGKRVVEEKTFTSSFSDAYYPESAWYSVTINAGEDQGIKEGMKFNIPQIDEEMFITQVTAKTAVGLINRPINDNRMDLCLSDNNDPISCPQIKISLKVKTQIGNFWW